jgi:hypothetical protein
MIESWLTPIKFGSPQTTFRLLPVYIIKDSSGRMLMLDALGNWNYSNLRLWSYYPTTAENASEIAETLPGLDSALVLNCHPTKR